MRDQLDCTYPQEQLCLKDCQDGCQVRKTKWVNQELTIQDLSSLLEEIGVSKIVYRNPKSRPCLVISGEKKIIAFANLVAKLPKKL